MNTAMITNSPCVKKLTNRPTDQSKAYFSRDFGIYGKERKCLKENLELFQNRERPPRRYGQMVSYFHAPYYVLHNDENENIPIIRYKRNKYDISLKIHPISLA